jgi:potassium efflux system protein
MLPINRSQHPVFALLFAMLFFFATAPLSWARADNSTISLRVLMFSRNSIP